MLAAIVNSLSRHHIDASEDDTVSTATRDRGTGTAVPLSDSTLPPNTDSRSNVGNRILILFPDTLFLLQ